MAKRKRCVDCVDRLDELMPWAWNRGGAGGRDGGVTDAFTYAELDEILRGTGRSGAIGMSAIDVRQSAAPRHLRRRGGIRVIQRTERRQGRGGRLFVQGRSRKRRPQIRQMRPPAEV